MFSRAASNLAPNPTTKVHRRLAGDAVDSRVGPLAGSQGLSISK